MNIERTRPEEAKAERIKMVSGGRLQVPSRIRRELGLEDGDQVTMEVRDGTLVVRPFRLVLDELRARFRPPEPPQRESHVDDFIADRRLDAERDR